MRPQPFQPLIDARATAIFQNAGLSITAARPEYVRYGPGETTIIGYVFTNNDRSTGRGYARWCESRHRADQIMDKALTLRPRSSIVGVSTVRVDAHTVFYGFPNDASLRRLRWYTTPRKLKRSLSGLVPEQELASKRTSSVEILRYKPERRLVARVELITPQGTIALLVRYTTASRAGALAAVATELRAHGVHTPAPLAQLDGGHVTVDEFIDGVVLRSAIRDGRKLSSELADALGAFHRTPSPFVRARSAARDGAKVVTGLENLSHWDPTLGEATDAVAAALMRAMPSVDGPTVLLHGDLHDENVLVGSQGLSFIDLERSVSGPAAVDLGCLLGHAISLGIRRPGWSPRALDHAAATIDAYRSRNSPIEESAICWHTAVALVDQALSVTRRFETNWRETAESLLDAAMVQLSGCAARPISIRHSAAL